MGQGTDAVDVAGHGKSSQQHRPGAILKCFTWVLSLGERERPVSCVAERLNRSMRVTAKCRYNASLRLQLQSGFSFFTVTVLSLGLIFIPLMQTAAVGLTFTPNVLNMMQIFLAVSILVYSVVIGTARYDVRADSLTRCADELKDLIRTLQTDIEEKGSVAGAQLSAYQARYSNIVTISENHTNGDHLLARLQMTNDYPITGIPRLTSYLIVYGKRGFGYALPTLMIAFEILFITEMLGATSLLVKYFGAN